MSLHDLIKALMQSLDIDSGVEAQSEEHVVHALAWIQLVQKPKSLLRKRRGKGIRFASHQIVPNNSISSVAREELQRVSRLALLEKRVEGHSYRT